MKYQVIRNEKYDFAGQSYSAVYPNLHKYPATMLPQIGIEILKELIVPLISASVIIAACNIFLVILVEY